MGVVLGEFIGVKVGDFGSLKVVFEEEITEDGPDLEISAGSKDVMEGVVKEKAILEILGQNDDAFRDVFDNEIFEFDKLILVVEIRFEESFMVFIGLEIKISRTKNMDRVHDK